MEPRDWSITAHNLGDFGWFPAPAAADAAVDKFCEALHKSPYYYHVFAIPMLMTNRSRNTMLKAVDVYFVLKPVCEIWDISQHELLGIFSLCPLVYTILGVSGTPSQWWTWRAPCEKCRTLIFYRKGIFCANFLDV
jgi:hypothetical protein